MPEVKDDNSDHLHELLRTRKMEGAVVLYDLYASTLHKIIFCTTRNLQLTDEVLIDTFKLAWEQLYDFFEQEKSLLRWLSGIAKRQAKLKMSSVPPDLGEQTAA